MRSRMARVNEGSHSFTCHPPVYPRMEWAILSLLHKHSPDGTARAHPISTYYSFIDLGRIKGWVGLVGWPVADGWPTLVVTHQLPVKCRAGKIRRPKTDVLPLCHASNYLMSTQSQR